MIREFDYSCVICTIQFCKRDDPSYILERHCCCWLALHHSQRLPTFVPVNHVLANTCYRIHICRALMTFNILSLLSLQIFLQYHFPLLLISPPLHLSPLHQSLSSPPTFPNSSFFFFSHTGVDPNTHMHTPHTIFCHFQQH